MSLIGIFFFKNCTSQSWRVCLIQRKNPRYFRYSWLFIQHGLGLLQWNVLKDEKLIKSKPTGKLKYANSILEPFEYFCQMSSKSILINSSYSVSKFGRFFLRHSVKNLRMQFCQITSELHYKLDCQLYNCVYWMFHGSTLCQCVLHVFRYIFVRLVNYFHAVTCRHRTNLAPRLIVMKY